MNYPLQLKSVALAIFALTTRPSGAAAFVDFEIDPLPLIKINALVPSTRLTASAEENLGLKILEECYTSGTQSLTKQKFQDALASFGASIEVTPGYEYLEVTLSFPLNGGKIPPNLLALTKENLEKPRVNAETFERARKLLKANTQGTLDRDSSLVIGAMQKFVARKLFQLTPFSIESFDKVTLKTVEDMQKSFYATDKDVWVGVIAPTELKEEIKLFVQELFPRAGKVAEGMHKQKLVSGYKPELKGSFEPTFILVDKPDLSQIHYGYLRVSSVKESPQFELIDNFTNYILTGSSLDSLHSRRIRADKGLAYSVGGLMSSYYDHPVYSLYANPQRNKQAEAFEVLEKIMKDTYEKGAIVSDIDNFAWASRILSYRNGERQGGATPEGRLGRRKAVATGDMSLALYDLSVDKWLVNQRESKNRLLAVKDKSFLVYGVIGDAKEVEPLLRKNFPTVKVLKVPYKDIIKGAWLL